MKNQIQRVLTTVMMMAVLLLPQSASAVSYFEKITNTTLPSIGLSAGDGMGRGMGSIDLNGDGRLEMVVGVPTADRAIVIFFNADGTASSSQNIPGPGAVGDIFGTGITDIGDQNGDGVPDMVIGAYSTNDGGNDRGAFYTFFMNADGTVSSTQKVSETVGGGPALDDLDNFGSAVAVLGDLDGNGVQDLAVSAANDDDGGGENGAVYVMFMNADGTASSSQKISELVGGGPDLDPGDVFGTGVTGIGDLNGDGVPDMFVGAEKDDDGGTDKGAGYVVFLNADGTATSTQKISDTTGGGPSLDPGGRFGAQVSSGDVNNDGIKEILVAAHIDDDGDVDAGSFYILYMNPDGTASSSQKISQLEGNGPDLDAGDVFGYGLALLSDMDNNGYPEIGVAALLDDDSGLDAGAAYVLFMKADGTVRSEPYTLIPDLVAGSDSGESSNDNITSDTTPTFDLVCNEATTTIAVYSDNPATSTLIATGSCTASSTITVTASAMATGTHNVVYTATNVVATSATSTALNVLIDTAAPTVPGLPATTTVGTTTLDINWPVSTDGAGASGVSFYTVYRDSVAIATTSTATFADTGLTPNTGYSYTVSATDVAGNVSAQSAAAVLTTSSAPGVTVSPTTLTVTEGDAASPVDFMLTSAPTATVTIAFATTTGEGTISTTTMVFTPANWNVPQTLNITPVDDALVDGTLTETVNLTLVSADIAYNGLAVGSYTITINDNDTPGVTSAPTAVSVTEGAAATTYTLRLNTMPTADVTIALATSTGEASLSNTSITFTSANYNVAQTIIVTAVDDTLTDGTTADTVSYTLTSGDGDYNGLGIATLPITVSDNEAPTSSGGGGGGSSPDIRINSVDPSGTTVDLVGEILDNDDWTTYYVLSTTDSSPQCTEGLTEYAVSGTYNENDTFTYTITGLQANTKYYVRLCGDRNGGFDDDSRVKNFVTGDAGAAAPSAPATPGTGEVGTVDEYGVCTPYLTGYVQLNNPANDPVEVQKVEQFLNDFQGENVPVDGVYSQADFEAVKRFQTTFSSEVLDVWGLNGPTGYVYITTKNKINSFYCNKNLQCPIFTQYNRKDLNNDSQEVRTTKIFMTELGFYTGAINTFYDEPIDAAITVFQETFREVMLDPWDLAGGTGHKYKSTNRYLNKLTGCNPGPVELDNGVVLTY